MPGRLVDNFCTTDMHTPRAGHVLNPEHWNTPEHRNTPEHQNTLEQPGTTEQLKNPGRPNLMVVFCFHITGHVKSKM